MNFSSLYPLEMDNLTAEFDVPYTYNFNLNVQRALPSNMVLTVGYVGSLGRKLMRAGDGNRTTQAGHDACLSGTGTGAPIVLGNNTFSCVQLANAQSLYFPGNKTQPAVVPGSQVPGLFPNGLPYYLSIGGMYTNGASSYNSLQVSLARLSLVDSTSLLRIRTVMRWIMPQVWKTLWQTATALIMSPVSSI